MFFMYFYNECNVSFRLLDRANNEMMMLKGVLAINICHISVYTQVMVEAYRKT